MFFEVEEVDGKSIRSLEIIVIIEFTGTNDEDGDDNGLNYQFIPLILPLEY